MLHMSATFGQDLLFVVGYPLLARAGPLENKRIDLIRKETYLDRINGINRIAVRSILSIRSILSKSL